MENKILNDNELEVLAGGPEERTILGNGLLGKECERNVTSPNSTVCAGCEHKKPNKGGGYMCDIKFALWIECNG